MYLLTLLILFYKSLIKVVVIIGISVTPSSDLYAIHLTPKTYKEESEGRRIEPRKRGLSFILDSLNRK